MFINLLLLPILLLSIGTDPPAAEAIADAILQSNDYSEASSRLSKLDPELTSPEWALKPLFDRVIAGASSDVYLNAVCHADAWSDGAWHLEMGWAAYEAVKSSPKAFASRYLGGSDCALLVLAYALQWPSESLDVDIDCGDDSRAAIARLDHEVSAIRNAVWSTTNLQESDPRHRILFTTTNALADAWPTQRDRFLEECDQRVRESGESPANK